MKTSNKVKENVTMSLLEYLDRTGKHVSAKTLNKYRDEKLTYDEWLELFW